MSPNASKQRKEPVFSAQLYEMTPGEQSWERRGVEAMDITIYLPLHKEYAFMKPRLVAFTTREGATMALRFDGVSIQPDEEQLWRLCRRIAAARNTFVKMVDELAERQ